MDLDIQKILDNLANKIGQLELDKSILEVQVGTLTNELSKLDVEKED